MFKRFVYLVLSLSCLGACGLFFLHGLNLYRANDLKQEIGAWQAERLENIEVSMARSRPLVERLLASGPNDPEAKFIVVKDLEWRSYLQRLSPRRVKRNREQIDRLLAEIIQLRPLWGRAWAARVLNTANMNPEWSAELERYLASALRLGRWEPSVQYYLVQFSYVHWQWIPRDQKKRLARWIEAVFLRGGPIKGFIKQYDSRYEAVAGARKTLQEEA